MFAVFACLSLTPPDPWEEFLYEVVWPFVRLNVNACACLLGVAALATLLIGLFGDLSTRERRVCGALPLSLGAATFIGVVVAARDARWWTVDSEVRTTLLAFAFCLSTLGLLVVERRLFIEDDG